MKNSIYCKIAKGEIRSEKIAETDNFFAIRDINPVSKGHALVIPKKHFVTILDIPNNLGKELLEITKKVSDEILEKKFGDGFNLIMNNLEVAGQLVMHAHIHVIPRNDGDNLKTIHKTN